MPEQHCTLLFLLKDNQILLGMKKRGFGMGKWNGIGGKIEKQEEEHLAMIRECQEEILVTPDEFQKVAKLHFKNQNPDGSTFLIIAHVYTCDQWQGMPTETEEMAPKWFAYSDIPYVKMWDDDQYWLPIVLEGKKVIGNFSFDKHDKVTLKNVKVVSDKELGHEF